MFLRTPLLFWAQLEEGIPLKWDMELTAKCFIHGVMEALHLDLVVTQYEGIPFSLAFAVDTRQITISRL